MRKERCFVRSEYWVFMLGSELFDCLLLWLRFRSWCRPSEVLGDIILFSCLCIRVKILRKWGWCLLVAVTACRSLLDDCFSLLLRLKLSVCQWQSWWRCGVWNWWRAGLLLSGSCWVRASDWTMDLLFFLIRDLSVGGGTVSKLRSDGEGRGEGYCKGLVSWGDCDKFYE